MNLKIVQVGEPVLRQAARKLRPAEILSDEIQSLIALMRETMRDAPGVGLAAPQIGVSLQIAVIEDKEEYLAGISAEQLAERERKPVAFHTIINPTLTLGSDPTVDFFEGCLSLAGFAALVPRARRVRVECLDEHGTPQVIEASDGTRGFCSTKSITCAETFILIACVPALSPHSTTQTVTGKTNQSSRFAMFLTMQRTVLCLDVTAFHH